MTSPRLRYLTIRGLCAIHREMLARYGGKSNSDKSNSGDPREVDLAMLELSIVRAELVVRGPRWKRRARLAAEYGWRVLLNRPFAVANNQMALAAMVTYLEMNRFTWKCGEVEETAMVLRAAAKGMHRAEWEAWVVRNVGKSSQ